jgi:hypothetical protein
MKKNIKWSFQPAEWLLSAEEEVMKATVLAESSILYSFSSSSINSSNVYEQ